MLIRQFGLHLPHSGGGKTVSGVDEPPERPSVDGGETAPNQHDAHEMLRLEMFMQKQRAKKDCADWDQKGDEKQIRSSCRFQNPKIENKANDG